MKNRLISNLNLGNRPAAVLRELLKLNATVTVSELAQHIHFPRQTLLSVLKQLSAVGLVIQTSKNGKLSYFSNYKQLLRYVESEKLRLDEIKAEIEYQKGIQLPTRTADGQVPRVEFYSGSLALKKLFEDILSLYKQGKNKRFRGYGINYFSDAPELEEYLNYFIKKRASYGVKTDLIVAQGPDGFNITPGKEYGRSIKKIYIDPQLAGFYMVANRVYLFSYKDNVGVMIENMAIANLLKDVFDDYWSKLNS
jgi:hypothetical protein